MLSYCSFSSAQTTEKQAVESPLDCYFFLLLKDNDRSSLDIESLAITYFELNKYEKGFATLNLLEDNDRRFEFSNAYASKLLSERKSSKANELLNYAVQNLDNKYFIHKRVLIQFGQNLIKLNRFIEARNLAKDTSQDEPDVSIAIVQELIESNQTEKAKSLINQPFFPLKLSNNETTANLALVYSELKITEKAEKLFAEIIPSVFESEKIYHNQRFILFPLIKAYLAIGRIDTATELWNQYGERDDGFGWMKFIDLLLEFGHREKATFYLAEIEKDAEILEKEGAKIVESYLKLGNIPKAINVAKTMSIEIDSYEQQRAFISLADYFIANSKKELALEILEFAFQRARKIVFEQQPQDSTSAGIRKKIYLANIYKRLMNLDEFEKAFKIINSIDSEHQQAKEFIAFQTIDFAKNRSHKLSNAQVDTLISQSQNLIQNNDDYYSIKIKLLTAEIYALMNKKDKAVDLIAEVLEDAKESCCYEKSFLNSSGKIFEKYKLKANQSLKKALHKIVDSKY